MKTAESRLATNPVYHAIAIGIADDISTRFNWINTILGTTNRGSVEFPVLQVSRMREGTIHNIPMILPQDIGRINIDEDGIHFYGLTQYDTSTPYCFTTVLLESPRMDEEVCDAVWKMIEHANQHRLLRAMFVTPAEQAGVGPGLDDD